MPTTQMLSAIASINSHLFLIKSCIFGIVEYANYTDVISHCIDKQPLAERSFYGRETANDIIKVVLLYIITAGLDSHDTIV